MGSPAPTSISVAPMALLSRRLPTFLDVASVGLLAVAVWLFWSRGRGDGVAPPSAVGNASRVAAGSVLAPFSVTDTAGVVTPGVAAGARGHVLLVFRSDCPACALQKPVWEALARGAEARGVRVVAYTPEPPVGPVRRYFAGAPVAVRGFTDAAAAGRALDLRMVPTTFVLDANGRVLLHHEGVMPPATADSARALVALLSSES